MSGHRLAEPRGRLIDRKQPLSFDFNGQRIAGFAGDSVASALLAQGVQLVGRSFKLHRPRGIFSCGVEEPSGVLDIGAGDRRVPNTRATDIAARQGLAAFSSNCWPSLRYDLGAVNARLAALMPAGFYYKTFMWPHWHWFEPAIRRLAGLGVAGSGPDPDRYDEVSANVDVLVVGGGAAGLQAALAAAQRGRQVTLLEGDAQLGGWLSRQAQPGMVDALRADASAAGVALHTRTTAVAVYDHLLVTAIEHFDAAGPLNGPLNCPLGGLRERLWKLRARQLILATGAFERPMLFPDNDSPGVMLAGAVERYASDYGVACGQRVVLAAACDSAYTVAASLCAARIGVAAIVDHRRAAGAVAALPACVEVLRGSAIVATHGRHAVSGVSVCGADGGPVRRIDADLIASAGGHTPNLSLYSQAGGSLRWLDDAAMFVPSREVPGIGVVGAAAGVFVLDAALDHAEAVGRTAPGQAMPAAPVGGAGQVPADNRPWQAALKAAGRTAAHIFVDLQNDVTAADVDLAARENYRSVEHLKRYTTLGMATDQGKSSNVNALVLLGQATERGPQAVGTTKFRPPYKPVTLNTLAGGRHGARLRPRKQLNARDWHAAHGALFEEFGGWERPAAYPLAGESLSQAAQREAEAVRQGVGLFEGSPLGKLEVIGPDAAEFLDLMYVGTLSTLAQGGARYGALLNENGVVVDDGIVARLGANHFWVNTTSAGAERVALGFEEWLQCEYVKLRVFVQPVTSQWGNVTVAGPRAWRLLQRIGADVRLAPAAMPHMTMRETEWDGQPWRVLRASFCGELSYEINLRPDMTGALLERLWQAGQDLGVCAYGVEALTTLRLEKAYLHLGADSDGTTLPQDLGLARGIAKKRANFVGRRSLSLPASQDLDRHQLVGLLPLDRKTVLPVGAHLSLRPPPTLTEGFITSSAYSPALQQPVALAMLKRGGQRLGERLQAWHLGRMVEAEVVKTPFFDPTGERLRG